TIRAGYQTLVAQFSQRILQLFPQGTRLSQPRGGFILWVELPPGMDGALIQKKALRHRISIAPGSIFSDDESLYRNFIRLNCAIPWTQTSQQALSQLAAT